jgi:hypothetical protein
LATANNVGTHRLIEGGIRSFESHPKCVRALVELYIRALRGSLGIKASKSGVKVIEREESLPQLLRLKQRRIVLQAAEQGAQIPIEFDGMVL